MADADDRLPADVRMCDVVGIIGSNGIALCNRVGVCVCVCIGVDVGVDICVCVKLYRQQRLADVV